jgi:hypothetical protein
MKAGVPCKYFHKDGYCAKGNYCEFLHGNKMSRKPCRFFASPQGCSRGKQCTFAHVKPDIKGKVSMPGGAVAAAPLSPASQPSSQSNSIDVPQNALNSLWGFEDDDAGVYFYGASGTGNFDEKHENRRYSEVVGEDPSCGGQRPMPPSINSRNVCAFYLSGSCRFGNACRNIHSGGGTDSSDQYWEVVDVRAEGCSEEASVLHAEVQACSEAECGICLTTLGERSRGLLSHCPCVFCLECIRSWRKEGVEIAKSSQVR